MQDDQYEAAADRWEECGRAVDGAGEHRRQDESQDGIKRRLLRQKSTVSAADDDKRRHEDDHAAEADLKEVEVCRLAAQPENRFETCDHSRHPKPLLARVPTVCP